MIISARSVTPSFAVTLEISTSAVFIQVVIFGSHDASLNAPLLHRISCSCKAGKEEIVDILRPFRQVEAEGDAAEHGRTLRDSETMVTVAEVYLVTVMGGIDTGIVPTASNTLGPGRISTTTLCLRLQRGERDTLANWYCVPMGRGRGRPRQIEVLSSRSKGSGLQKATSSAERGLVWMAAR